MTPLRKPRPMESDLTDDPDDTNPDPEEAPRESEDDDAE